MEKKLTLKEASDILAKAGITDSREEARRIFSLVGGFPHYALLSPALETDNEAVINAITRRCSREPLAYIIGEVEFYRERYKVTPDCLIPRSDTEILVDTAVKNLPCGASFLDLCTGSGCVALSVLKNTEDTRCTAVDISPSGLELAKENAKRLGLSHRIDFVLADACERRIDGDFFAVLSNPPYVSSSAYRTLEREIYFEPPLAFLGGEDGGDFYRAITPLYKSVAERGGFIAFEIGFDQGRLVSEIALENALNARIIQDLSKNDRVALLRGQ